MILRVTHCRFFFDGAVILVDAPCLRVSGCCAGTVHGRVQVVRSEQTRTFRTHVGQREHDFGWELSLNIEIPLLRVRRAEIRIEGSGCCGTDKLKRLLLFGRRWRREWEGTVSEERIRERNIEHRNIQNEGLNQRKSIQPDRREIVIENAISAANSSSAIAKWIPGKAETRSEIHPVRVDDVGRQLRIALEQQTPRRAGVYGGLQARPEGTLFPAGLGEVQVGLPSEAESNG